MIGTLINILSMKVEDAITLARRLGMQGNR
jgi:hypothetical protein